jgi:hypothetical protein
MRGRNRIKIRSRSKIKSRTAMMSRIKSALTQLDSCLDRNEFVEGILAG